MAVLKNGTWVLLADGRKALFLRNDLDEMTPDLNVVRIEEIDNPPTREQGTDKPGRFPADPGPKQRSAVAETDWHQLAEQRFADELADLLYRYAHKGAFKSLVLVVPAPVLGELRKKLHKEVTDRIVAVLEKDLTNMPLDKVEEMLKAELDPKA